MAHSVATRGSWCAQEGHSVAGKHREFESVRDLATDADVEHVRGFVDKEDDVQPHPIVAAASKAGSVRSDLAAARHELTCRHHGRDGAQPPVASWLTDHELPRINKHLNRIERIRSAF